MSNEMEAEVTKDHEKNPSYVQVILGDFQESKTEDNGLTLSLKERQKIKWKSLQ